MGWLGFSLMMLLAMLLLPAGGRVDARLLLEDCPEPYVDCRDPEEIARWIDTRVLPIPQEPQPPLSSYRERGAAGWALFRSPFPRVPLWNPPGPKRVGLQAGHWLYAEAPDDLAELRNNPGSYGGGRAEWEVNLDIAERTAALLREAGVEVDVLPTAVPVRYRAHAFVTIHADGDPSGVLTGYKVARSGFSSTPEVDDHFAEILSQEYGAATGLARQDHQISHRMRWYYAFNARRYQHAVAPGVPQAIIEAGFLTSATDRRLLIGEPDRAARGIANGILKFLQRESPKDDGRESGSCHYTPEGRLVLGALYPADPPPEAEDGQQPGG